MYRSNFFHKFFKYKESRSNQIIKYDSNRKFNLQDQINNKITEIDQKISESSKAILEAQIIKFKYTISKSNNFIENIGQNIYKKKVEDSLIWHQKELKELYLKRKILQINLEKTQGIYWLNQIKRFITLIFIGFFILLSLFIFFSGFMITIYLLPLIILIIIGYFLANKKYN